MFIPSTIMASSVSTILSTSITTFTPALPPPTGVQSNPENPESLAVIGRVAIGICIPIVTIVFGLRSFVRLYYKGSWSSWIYEDCERYINTYSLTSDWLQGSPSSHGYSGARHVPLFSCTNSKPIGWYPRFFCYNTGQLGQLRR